MCVPAALTNVPAVNRQAVSLGVSTIELSNPVHAHWIVVCRFHFLLLVHLKTLGGGELLIEEFGAGETDGVVGWLVNVEGRETIGGRFRVDCVLRISLVRLESCDRLGVERLLVDRLRVDHLLLRDLSRGS